MSENTENEHMTREEVQQMIAEAREDMRKEILAEISASFDISRVWEILYSLSLIAILRDVGSVGRGTDVTLIRLALRDQLRDSIKPVLQKTIDAYAEGLSVPVPRPDRHEFEELLKIYKLAGFELDYKDFNLG